MYINLVCNGCNRKGTGKCQPDCKHYPFPKDMYEKENIYSNGQWSSDRKDNYVSTKQQS